MIGRTAKTVLRHSRQQARPPRKLSPFRIEADHIGGRNHVPHITVDECQPDHVRLWAFRHRPRLRSQPPRALKERSLVHRLTCVRSLDSEQAGRNIRPRVGQDAWPETGAPMSECSE